MRRAMLGMLLAASFAVPAAAADLVAKATEAQTLADQGKFIEAIAALDARSRRPVGADATHLPPCPVGGGPTQRLRRLQSARDQRLCGR